MSSLVSRTALEFVTAFRNVTRHRRRVLFALLIIVGGVLALLMTAGFIMWLMTSMREGAIRSQIGHIQIVRPGFFEGGGADPYRYLLQDDAKADNEIRRSPHVEEVTPRLAFNGLVSFNDSSVTFVGDGVDPVGDRRVNEYISIVEGEALSEADPDGIIIGRGLAANLGVKVGDRVVLLGTTAKGGFNMVEVRVRGTFQTFSSDYDNSALRAPIMLARKLIKVSGSTAWVVLLDQTERSGEVHSGLSQKLDPKQYQLVEWIDLADMYVKTRDLFEKQVLILQLIISFIIVLSIGNTLHMAVLERTGEIGTAMALGVRRGGVLRQFLMEGLILGCIGGLIGVVLAWGLSYVVSTIGIPMPPPPGMLEGFDAEVTMTPGLLLDGFLTALITTLVASAIPAWKASRMNIVDALRHQR